MTTTSTNPINKIIEVLGTSDLVKLEEVINELKVLPTIVIYYILKGFKVANQTKFYEFTTFVRTTEFWEEGLRVILNEVFEALYTEEDNYEAYKGFGKLQDYVDYYNSVI